MLGFVTGDLICAGCLTKYGVRPPATPVTAVSSYQAQKEIKHTTRPTIVTSHPITFYDPTVVASYWSLVPLTAAQGYGEVWHGGLNLYLPDSRDLGQTIVMGTPLTILPVTHKLVLGSNLAHRHPYGVSSGETPRGLCGLCRAAL